MLLKFINRGKELEFLEERYRLKKAEFIPIYGRRRVGKTELIKQFVKDKPHFYFLARKRDLRLELDRFQEKFSMKFNVFIKKTDSWERLFEAVSKNIKTKKKFVIVIDEFPFWIEKNKEIVSEFQYMWDEILKKKDIMLILCGSYVSMMENKVLGTKSPLYGRRTGQLKINTLNFKEFAEFFPSWKFEDIVKAYGAVDGIPFYIKEFELKTFLDNVKNTFWKRGSILNEEAEILLKEELREVDRYLSIMRSIFEGASKLNEIASKSYVDITNINKYLNVLLNLKLIKKVYPVIIKRPKRKDFIYRINDNFFNFWLSYVYPYQDEIEIGEIDSLLEFFKKDYSSYMGKIFEEVSKQFLMQIRGKKIFRFRKIGNWWWKDKEIDLIAFNEETGEIGFVECKWRDKVNAEKVLSKLKEKAKYVDWYNEKRKESFAVLAKSFSKRLDEFEGKKAYCFDLKDLERVLKD